MSEEFHPFPKSKQLEEKNTPSSLLQNAGPVDEDTAPSPCVESCRRTGIIEGLQMAFIAIRCFKMRRLNKTRDGLILLFVVQLLGTNDF